MTPARPTLSYNDIAQHAKKSLRPYGVQSVCDAALNSFAYHCGNGLQELRSAPWLGALLVKFSLEDLQTPLHLPAPCPPQVFDSLRQMLWEVSPLSEASGPQSVFLGLRAMLNTQLQFQQNETFSFVRWPALVLELPEAHPTRMQFESVLGMSPTAFIGLCWAAYAQILDQRQIIGRSYFKTLEPLYGPAVSAFLQLFSRNVAGLRTEIRADFDRRLTVARIKGELAAVRDPIEVTQFPWLQKYPLLLLPSGDYAVWHRLIFARSVEQAVHRSLSTLGQKYTDPFSKEFEKYVLSLLKETGLTYQSEEEFKTLHGRDSAAVEAIVECAGGRVLVECKMSLFPDEVVSSDSRQVVFQKLRRIREAVVQGWRVTDVLARAGEGSQLSGQSCFLVVVTSRQLNVCNGEHLKRLFGDNVFDDILPESKFGRPSEQQFRLLPAQNMFFLSVEEFEHLSGCLIQKQLDLLPLLSSASDAQKDLTSSVFQFDQLLGKYTKKWWTPPMQVRARDRVERELVEFFQNQ